jgi:hypothetical protein
MWVYTNNCAIIKCNDKYPVWNLLHCSASLDHLQGDIQQRKIHKLLVTRKMYSITVKIQNIKMVKLILKKYVIEYIL